MAKDKTDLVTKTEPEQVNYTEVVPKGQKLSLKQKLFINAYMSNGCNATQAAIMAGYSENSACVIGSENLSKPEIKDEIDRLLRLKMEVLGITPDFVANNIKEIAADPTTGKMAKLRANELLGKTQGMFTDRTEIDLAGKVSVQFSAPRPLPAGDWEPDTD